MIGAGWGRLWRDARGNCMLTYSMLPPPLRVEAAKQLANSVTGSG